MGKPKNTVLSKPKNVKIYINTRTDKNPRRKRDRHIKEWESKPLAHPALKYGQNGHNTQRTGPILPSQIATLAHYGTPFITQEVGVLEIVSWLKAFYLSVFNEDNFGMDLFFCHTRAGTRFTGKFIKITIILTTNMLYIISQNTRF